MSIPPVSDEDLAQLVLGYLYDEELMTVYDEFLSASPHLDSHKNEYKRIWMKSLHSIVSEFGAIKIHVEKCRPLSLRKRLRQCSNLIEIFKFLVMNVDIKKIPPYTATSHRNSVPETVSLKDKSNDNNMDTSILTETTALSDLPGNNHFPAQRKQMKVLVKDSEEAARLTADFEDSVESNPESEHVSLTRPQLEVSSVEHTSSYLSNLSSKSNNLDDISQKSKDSPCHPVSAFSNDYVPDKDDVCAQNVQQLSATSVGSTQTENTLHTSAETANTEEYSNNIPPLNSTGHILPTQPVELPKPVNHVIQLTNNNQYLIQVTNTRNFTVVSTRPNNTYINKDGSEHTDGKVTILSDVKVDKNSVCKNKEKKPPALQSTSTIPLQTIVVNGTPAYKPEPRKSMFTRDEIMAMPTLIVVSAPGPPPVSTSTVVSKCTTPATSVTMSSDGATPSSLKPLVIDISDSPVINPLTENQNMPLLNASTQDIGLIKTVDHKNVSAPKDMFTQNKTNTPQGLPLPSRKASSTPRRHSHIRVLDFTTPRRILHETMNENPAEVIISRSPNLNIPNVSVPVETQPETSVVKATQDDSATKENKAVPKKKSNWDDDLRALVNSSSQVQPAREPRKNKKVSAKKTEITRKKNNQKKTPKRKSKKKQSVDVDESNECENIVTEATEKTVKPTINIITDWNNPPAETDKTENKSAGDTDIETPEMERLESQHPIGLKMNISDILQTPFKQALYDIQMDTPKFLRPDIPISDEPVSEIKITDIPTPRFFDSPGHGYPKPNNTVATPSSYSSRPTDYSSGGSYYKPEECEYVPRPEDLGSPIKYASPCKPEASKSKVEDSKNSSSIRRSSRPVRKCAKNVSYCDARGNILGKTSDVDASANDTSVDSIVEKTGAYETKGETKKEITTKSKTENRRKSTSGTSKKQKTPVKKSTQKQFMKIKPLSSPKRDSRRRSTNTPLPSKTVLSRKRTVIKEKISTPSASAAPTKSRRKSSTPRKLHTKVLTSSSESPDISTCSEISKETQEKPVQESDVENLPLRWSDDGSQDAKSKDAENLSANEIEDITHIKAYIEQSLLKEDDNTLQNDLNSLHIDLVKRGFDVETAKSIERDLLDINPQTSPDSVQPTTVIKDTLDINEKDVEIKSKEIPLVEVTKTTNNLETVDEDFNIDEVEFSTHECNADDKNYITWVFDETIERPGTEPHKIKDNFTMEFCMEDDVILLKAASFTELFDEMPREYDFAETEAAVSSISNFERLYTPVKSSIQTQCREIFDSTLTSLDTPLKPDTPNKEVTVSEIVLEVERIETKKRKRVSGLCSEEILESKRSKRESRLLPNIQNMDIESVLSKLHGP